MNALNLMPLLTPVLLAILIPAFVPLGLAIEGTAPDKIPGLVFWLKADRGVTQSAGLVSAWADQSTSSNNATQSLSENQPTYISIGLNGKPVVRFTGAPVTMGFNSVTTQTVFVVYKDNGTTDSYGDILGNHLGTADFHGDVASTGKLLCKQYASASVCGKSGFVDGAPTDPADMAVDQSFHIYSFETSAPTSFSNLANNQDQPDRFRKGDYAEIIAFFGALNDKERGAIADYLSDKYAIPLVKPTASKKLSVYADGDSVTIYPNNYTEFYPTDIPCVVTNVAVSGQSQEAMLSRLQTQILANNPDIITISTFLNDMSTEASVLEKNIVSYVSQILAHRNPKTGLPPQLILMTDNLSGQNLNTPWPRPYATQVDTANRVLAVFQRFEGNPNVQIVNNFASFDALGGRGNPDSDALFATLLSDKVHPNIAGYAIIHANLKKPLSYAANRVLSSPKHE